MKKIRILITDDHQLVREGMEALIGDAPDMETVGMAASGEDAVNEARSKKPDVVIMDIVMPGMNGLEAARWIKEIDEGIRVLIVTMEVSKEYVSAAMKSGVDGYLPKSVGKDILLEAIRTVHGGEQFFTEAITKLIYDDLNTAEKQRSQKNLPNQLTKREKEVLSFVAAGKSNKEIAELLYLSVKTVETHKTHILMKLGLNNNAELVRYALKYNIISM